MKGREDRHSAELSRRPFNLIFFLLLVVIVCLQVVSLYRSFHCYRLLSRIGESRSSAALKSGERGLKKYEQSVNKKNRLVWSFRVEPKTLNPLSSESDIYTKWIAVPYIFEPLMMRDYNDMSLKPLLAESYIMSRDGLTITFRLKDGIYFSDGHPVNSEDVVFTYRTAVNPAIDAGDAVRVFSEVNRVKALDEKRVRFYLERPYFKALEDVSFCEIGVLPSHIYRFDNPRGFNAGVSNPLGSGPYIFEQWKPGQKIVLKCNRNYWGPEPRIKKMVYKFISSPLACLQALKAHQVDIMIPEPGQFAEVVKDEDFRKDFYCLSYWSPWTPFYYIGWNQETVFFKDRTVRLAMTHLLDRETIVHRLLKGYGKVITGPFYFRGNQNDPNINPWPYDIAKARELLDECRWIDRDDDGLRDKNGRDFRFSLIYSSGYALYDRLARTLKDQMARVGIEVVPEPYEWSALLQRLKSRNFEANIAAWGGGFLQDPYRLWHSSQIGDAGCNYVGFDNRRADAIIDKIRVTLDENQRNKLFSRLHHILHQQQPYTFLYTRPSLRLVDRRFKNVKIYNLGLKYHQWYVPKDKQSYVKRSK